MIKLVRRHYFTPVGRLPWGASWVGTYIAAFYDEPLNSKYDTSDSYQITDPLSLSWKFTVDPDREGLVKGGSHVCSNSFRQ